MNLHRFGYLTIPILLALLTVPALAQSPMMVPAPTETVPSPPKGTGVITGRVVYEGGRPAAGIVVVADMQIGDGSI